MSIVFPYTFGNLSGTIPLANLDSNFSAINLTLGSAAYLAVGTGASQIVQLDGSAKLPAVDGSQLTGLPSSTVITGAVFDYIGLTAPSGYVLLSGRTIGDASSGATERANADTSALFTLLWNSFADSEAAVSGGRGANAAADFAAHKTIKVPDARGRVIAGKDDMGGSVAGRLTAAGSGITGTTIGIAGGEQTHTLTTSELATHSHSDGVPILTGSADGVYRDGVSVNNANSTLTYYGTGNAGSGTAHNNAQPTLVFNKIIKL